jgi:predicted solute-binding protein
MPAPAEPSQTGPAGTYRVGRIPYFNSVPYFLHWPELSASSGGTWQPAEWVPRLLGRAADEGTIDAGLFAVADLARLDADFEPLLAPEIGLPFGLGIANLDRVESVLLFQRSPAAGADGPQHPALPPPIAPSAPGRLLRPSEAARLRHARVALTTESSTSVRLLRVLLAEKHSLRTVAYARGMDEDDLARADAALVIGDQALRWRRSPPPEFSLVMDLAAEWHHWTGLPFVFARWGVRRTVPAPARAWLARFLLQSVERAEPMLASAENFLASPLNAAPNDLGSVEEMRAYIRLIRYRLGADEVRAAERFRGLLERGGLLDPDL